MKKTLSLLLLVVLLVPAAIMPALASDPAQTVHFKVIYGWPEDQYYQTFDMSADDTLGSLAGMIRGLTNTNWNPPGPSDGRIGNYYGGYVTIDLIPPKPTYPPDFVVTIPEATRRPASQSEANRSTFRNITGSTIYLYQVYANGKTLDFRLYDGDTKIAFLESFDAGEDGRTRLIITIWQERDDLRPEYTAEALDYLESLEVEEVVLRSKGKETVYTMDELREMLPGSEG